MISRPVYAFHASVLYRDRSEFILQNISIRKEWVEQAPLLVSRAAGANALMATFKSPMCKELAPALVDKLVEHFATCLESPLEFCVHLRSVVA